MQPRTDCTTQSHKAQHQDSTSAVLRLGPISAHLSAVLAASITRSYRSGTGSAFPYPSGHVIPLTRHDAPYECRSTSA